MIHVYNKLVDYLQYPFVCYAIVVGVLISLCASLVGVVLVLKRYSMIGDGLSHVAFGSTCIAMVVSVSNDILIVLPITIVSAVLLLCGERWLKIKGDASIAMVSVGSLALGYLLLNLFPTSGNISGDVCTTLFGSTSILTLTESKVWLCTVLAIVVLLIFVFGYNKIFAITFDEDFAKATGMPVSVYKLILSIVIAVIIVLAMNLVGSLLISALVVFPVISAMRLFGSFIMVTIFSGILGVFCTLLGIIISILAGTPVGATIVTVQIVVFIICAIIGRLKK